MKLYIPINPNLLLDSRGLADLNYIGMSALRSPTFIPHSSSQYYFNFDSCSFHITILLQCCIYVNLLKRAPRKIVFTNWVTLVK